jgi:hypothetical protein
MGTFARDRNAGAVPEAALDAGKEPRYRGFFARKT